MHKSFALKEILKFTLKLMQYINIPFKAKLLHISW